MANKKTSELDELHNIQNDDLVEITKYMGAGLGDGGGDYKSYKMTWAALKAFFKYDEIVKIDFDAGEGNNYEPDRYELIHAFAYVQSTSLSQTIYIDYGISGEVLQPETDANAGSINKFCIESDAIDRNIYIETSAAGTVYLFVTKNLIP